MPTPDTPPNILSIAGSDPSGGAGIQADLKAISANGGYGMAVITALTAQNTRGVQGVEPVPPAFITRQIEAIFADIQVDAVKIGMLGSTAATKAVTDALSDKDVPVVLDPVMVAKGGSRLLADEATDALQALLPLTTVITPNLPEAAELLNQPEATTRNEMERQAIALLTPGPRAVFLKGGHLADDSHSPDLFLDGTTAAWIKAPRIDTPNTHGTGCTLSAALATRLALEKDPLKAARAAKAYTLDAIRAADGLSVGQGHGPTDHFFALRG